jgi:hypothetical protein
MNWNSVGWGNKYWYWAEWSSQGRTKSPTNQPRKCLHFRLSLLSMRNTVGAKTQNISSWLGNKLYSFNCHHSVPKKHEIMLWCMALPLQYALCMLGRKYWMICRGLGFLAIVWFSFMDSLPPLPSASCLSFSLFLCVAGRAYRRERWGRSPNHPNHTAAARKPGPL